MKCLKLKTIYKCLLSAPIKGRSHCYATLHCDVNGLPRTWHIYNSGKTLYRDRSRVKESLLPLKKQTAKHAKLYGHLTEAHALVICWPYIMYRFTCIVISQVFVCHYMADILLVRRKKLYLIKQAHTVIREDFECNKAYHWALPFIGSDIDIYE